MCFYSFLFPFVQQLAVNGILGLDNRDMGYSSFSRQKKCSSLKAHFFSFRTTAFLCQLLTTNWWTDAEFLNLSSLKYEMHLEKSWMISVRGEMNACINLSKHIQLSHMLLELPSMPCHAAPWISAQTASSQVEQRNWRVLGTPRISWQ